MIDFSELEPNTLVYVIGHNPISVLELIIVELTYDAEYIRKIKLENRDISFEVEFDAIKENMYLNREYAMAAVTKFVFDETNKFIYNVTDGFLNDYFDLDTSVEKYKISYPELFV